MSTAATSRCAAGRRPRRARGQLPARGRAACARRGGCRGASGGAAAEQAPKPGCAAPQLALLHALGNPSKALRHVVGTNIAVIMVAGGLAAWPELLVRLVQCLESSDAHALEGALDALYKVRRARRRPRAACRGRGRLSGPQGAWSVAGARRLQPPCSRDQPRRSAGRRAAPGAAGATACARRGAGLRRGAWAAG